MAKSHDFPRIDDLMDRLVLHPESGHIWLDDRRVFMMHAAAYGALRRELIESLGLEVARGLLTRIGYLSGSRDAELAKKIRKTADICEIFAIGPQLHALQGIVQVETVTMDIDVGKGNFYGEFLWRGSVECEAHMIDYGIGPEPVCWMQIGFASGFSSVFMGKPILFRETECRGMGHEACRVVGKPLSDWEDIDDLKFFNAQPFANREVSTHHKDRCLTPHHLQIAPHCVADSRDAVFPVWSGDVIASPLFLNRFSNRTQPGLGSAKPNEPGGKQAKRSAAGAEKGAR